MRKTILTTLAVLAIGGAATGIMMANAQPAGPPPGADGPGGRPWSHACLWFPGRARMRPDTDGAAALRPGSPTRLPGSRLKGLMRAGWGHSAPDEGVTEAAAARKAMVL